MGCEPALADRPGVGTGGRERHASRVVADDLVADGRKKSCLAGRGGDLDADIVERDGCHAVLADREPDRYRRPGDRRGQLVKGAHRPATSPSRGRPPSDRGPSHPDGDESHPNAAYPRSCSGRHVRSDTARTDHVPNAANATAGARSSKPSTRCSTSPVCHSSVFPAVRATVTSPSGRRYRTS